MASNNLVMPTTLEQLEQDVNDLKLEFGRNMTFLEFCQQLTDAERFEIMSVLGKGIVAEVYRDPNNGNAISIRDFNGITVLNT